ncbi:MAG TPA: helicase-related protein [Bryobacteraceae bacterium]|nr:helicase-related protein [Bryobacteraceae bacterium]
MAFFEQLWSLLTDDLHLLEPVTPTGHRGRPLPGCLGGHQIDADKLVLLPATGVYRCAVCRRFHSRVTPGMACTGFRCQGTIAFEAEDPDNFDLMVLDQKYAMIRPREHSAQIPAADREQIERSFKSSGERLNTLVATPTLELGVDIGSLDSVLMRNVPPRTSNYWQRAGRAGRRHRMAVDITYARPVSHDRAYFADPLKMLNGAILPPSFNLKNDVMVRKHVHATVLTVLHHLSHD